MESDKLLERLSQLEDKATLLELTNNYLAAADRKKPAEMASFFTENGMLTSIMQDGTIQLKGRIGIAEGFTKILAPITKAYHMNGQFLVSIAGSSANGTSYCFVTLRGEKEGKPYTRKIWAKYVDLYKKEEGKWLIENRTATVEHEEWQ